MSWHVYKKDDPSTWPEIDCPILIYDDVWCEFHICKWNHIINRFFEPKEKLLHTWKECYYQYIGYVPNGYKAVETKKCNLYPEQQCAYVDDGYCFDAPDNALCGYCQEITEYSLNDLKRIWKEFEK